MSCAPFRSPSSDDGICYSFATLRQMLQLVYVDTGSKDPTLRPYTQKHKTKAGIVDTLQTLMLPETVPLEHWADSEIENPIIRKWVKTDYIKNRMLSELLPVMPQEPLLSSENISNVLSGYQQNYRYRYMSCGVIHYDKKDDLLPLFLNIRRAFDYPKRYVRYSVVINTGGHWVCLFIDKTQKLIEYWDSMGKKPPKATQSLINDIIGMFTMYTPGISWKTKYSGVQHQFGAVQCGVYCIWYIVSRLQGKSMTEINSKIVKDKTMCSYKKRYFRPLRNPIVIPDDI